MFECSRVVWNRQSHTGMTYTLWRSKHVEGVDSIESPFGGFGVVPWRQHLLARGALLARYFFAWSSGSPDALISNRQLRLQARLANSLGVPDLTQRLLAVHPCRPL